MKHAIIFASTAIASGLFMANLYNSIVDVPSWTSNVPVSIDTARQYFRSSNPGDFFRIFSPLNQLLGLLALLLFWKRSTRVRWFLLSAFLLYVAGEGMTFLYFYPRNEFLFMSDISNVEALRSTLEEWRSMNWVRSAVIAAGVVCSFFALHNAYLAQGAGRHARASVQAGSKIVVA